MTDRLDAHYQGFTPEGHRLQITASGVPAPAKQELDGLIAAPAEGVLDKLDHGPMRLVSAHTAWDDENAEHTWRTGCFPYDPKFDYEDDDEDDDAAET